MLKKYAKHSIIVLIQLSALAIITALIAPLILSHIHNMDNWHDFFIHFQGFFLIGHSLFYIALYCLWPHLICFLTHRQPEQPSSKQINNAMRARYYLIGAFLMFELLNLLR